MMSSFVSDSIQSIFLKYDDQYIAPPVKRFLKECIVQLISVSLKSMASPTSTATNPNPSTLGQSVNPIHSVEKQLSLLTEWLENFVEPAHISMYTHTVIHIMRQFQLQHSGHHHHYISTKGIHHATSSSHQSRPSLSITTPLESAATTVTMTPIEEAPCGFHKRLSLFNRAWIRRVEGRTSIC